MPVCGNGFSRAQFTDAVGLQREGRLDDRSFRSHDKDLVILVPEAGTDAPWIPDREHLAASGDTAHHIAAVKARHRRAKDIADVDVLFDIFSDSLVPKTFLPGFEVDPFALPVEPVPHQFQHHVGV